MTPTIKFKKLNKYATIPQYQTPWAAGMDLHWDGVRGFKYFCALAGGAGLYSTGIAAEIPEGYEGHIRPRSGLSKQGLLCHFGTVDSDYRGELFVCLQVLDFAREDEFRLDSGDRIAQLVIVPVARCVIQVTEDLSPSARGAGGFGSTGK